MHDDNCFEYRMSPKRIVLKRVLLCCAKTAVQLQKCHFRIILELDFKQNICTAMYGFITPYTNSTLW